jgi:hypothetical protein
MIIGLALVTVCCAFAVMSYITRRITASDMAWGGTRAVGVRLLVYAADHGGRFPVSLTDSGFASNLSADDRAYLEHLHPQYRPPTIVGTNTVEILAVQTKWERVVFWSDGNLNGVRR